MTSLNTMFRRLDRLAVAGQEPTVVVALCPPGLSSDERGRLRELIGLTRRSAAESAELDGLLQRAPEVEAALDGSRCATLLYASDPS
jgi:hypothetical protein